MSSAQELINGGFLSLVVLKLSFWIATSESKNK